MKYLLELEWKKAKNFRPFQVMAILYLALLPTILLVGKAIPDPPNEVVAFINGFYMFPTVWKYLGYVGNWMGFFFLGFMAVLTISSEFGNKTLRQNIITGMTRKQFFWSKVIFIGAISVIATVYFSLIGITLGFFHSDPFYWDVFTQNLDYIPRFFLMTFGYMTIGLLIGAWVRRTGIAIFLFLAYGMFIELILRYLIHLNTLRYFDLGGFRTSLFYPANVLEDLAPVPSPDFIKEMTEEWEFKIFLEPMEASIASIIYIALFLFLLYRLLTRKDL